MLVITDVGTQAINDVKTGNVPLPGIKLELVQFKVTDGTADPLVSDTASVFEADGSVYFTGTAASGHIANKTIIDANTFQIDLIVPPEEPTAGGSFPITKIGLYVPDPQSPANKILFGSTKFANTFVKESPSLQTAGNSLILTLIISFNKASETLEVYDTSQRDHNILTELASVDVLGPAQEAVNRTYRITKTSEVAGTGKNSFLVNSTKNAATGTSEWIPDNHSLLFPIHALAALTNGEPSDGKTHGPTTLRLLYYHNNLDLTSDLIINMFPAVHTSLIVSFFIDNPPRSGGSEGVGGKMRTVSAVTSDLYYTDPVNGPGNGGAGNELITIQLTTAISPLPALNSLIKIYAPLTAGVSSSGGSGGGGLTEGTPDPIAQKLVKRDENGRAKVVPPIETDHIATLGTVNTAKTGVIGLLDTHKANAAAHADQQAVAATPNKLVKRDINGRAQIAEPVADGDITNKLFVETRATAIEDNIVDRLQLLVDDSITTFLNANLQTGWLDPAFDDHNADLLAHTDLIKEAPTPNTAIKRSATGTGQVLMSGSPSANDIVNSQYFDTTLAAKFLDPASYTAASVDALSNKLALRNSTGQSSFAAPTANEHAVNLIHFVTEMAAAFANPTSYTAASVDALANKIALRNSTGQASFAAPTANDHAVNLLHFTTALAAALADPASFAAASTTATPEKLARRNANGQSSFADPTDSDHAVNKRHLERFAPRINPTDNPKNGDLQVNSASGITRVYVYGNGAWLQVFPARYS